MKAGPGDTLLLLSPQPEGSPTGHPRCPARLSNTSPRCGRPQRESAMSQPSVNTVDLFPWRGGAYWWERGAPPSETECLGSRGATTTSKPSQDPRVCCAHGPGGGAAAAVPQHGRRDKDAHALVHQAGESCQAHWHKLTASTGHLKH